MGPVGQPVNVLQGAREGRLLNCDRNRRVALGQVSRGIAGGRVHRQSLIRDALRTGDRGGDLFVSRVDAGRQDDATGLDLTVAARGHQRRLGECRGAVVQRRVAHVETGELGDHRLVLVDGLQRALARLRLVRRIRAVVLAAGRYVPDRLRDVMLVSTRADEAKRRTVLHGALAHQARNRHLAHRLGHAIERADDQVLRDFVEQVVEALRADPFQHLARVVVCMGNKRHRLSQASSSSSSSW